MKQIPLTTGGVAIVDDEDVALVAGLPWFRNNCGYAVRSLGSGKQQKTVLMHRVILDVRPGEMVDHANGDTLDNRRENIRKCVSRENQRNKRKPRTSCGAPTTSRFKGVNWDRQTCRWRAKIHIEGRRTMHLGRFNDEATAARAYDSAALTHFGDFARLNFPTSQPRVAPC